MSYKVVYNARFGGFGLSSEAVEWLRARGLNVDEHGYMNCCEKYCYCTIERHNPLLVECVETLGEDTNGSYAAIKVATVKDRYMVNEYDSSESVVQPEDLNFSWIDPRAYTKPSE